MKKYQIIVKGRVQGVCFRDFTRRTANSLNILGIVKNLINGDVKVVAVANEDDMKKFISKLRIGPSMARVNDLEITNLDSTREYTDFKIVF